MSDNIFDIKDYYPTPISLIDRMLSEVNFNKVRNILEPSAGDGNIAEAVKERLKRTHRYKNTQDIDCIEINENLRHILKGKGFRVVHDDFLTYETYKKYSLIIMNPPFGDADKHILKALEMIESGGQLVALCNSETIKNAFSNSRKDLVNKLHKYNAKIKYLQQEFSYAERKTDVEIALISVDIPSEPNESIILNKLKQEEFIRQQQNKYNNSVIEGDFIKGIIQQYKFELEAGLNLINEYENIQRIVKRSFKSDGYGDSSILGLTILHGDKDDFLTNQYIRKVRSKYWEALFKNDNFTQMLTSEFKNKYLNMVNELQDYDFSYYNIKEIQNQMNQNVIVGIEDCIMKLFDEFTYQHSYYKEMKNNIHYFNGWCSNSCFKINKKIVTTIGGYDKWRDYCTLALTNYKVVDRLKDIEKVFNYLDEGKTPHVDLDEVLKEAQAKGETKEIKTKYMELTFYKKNTTHIKFLNEELLHKFNLFGSMKKGFLPPSYGQKRYEDMTDKEKSVIDEFEGKNSYNKVINNTGYYLYNPNKVLMLGGEE